MRLMPNYFLLILGFLFSFSCFAYEYNPYVLPNEWEELKPYFLPENHPVKGQLDEIFKERVSLCKDAFEAAGFEKIRIRSKSNLIIGKHPLLKGYILKLFLDTQIPLSDGYYWKNRIDGANLIRTFIKKNHFRHLKVPRKWIYPLPTEPSPPPTHFRKNYVLVVEDMNLVSNYINVKLYKKEMSKEMLRELILTISKLELIDSVWADNTPFNYLKKLCFIDTEHYMKGKVNFDKLKSYLSQENKNFLEELLK